MVFLIAKIYVSQWRSVLFSFSFFKKIFSQFYDVAKVVMIHKNV